MKQNVSPYRFNAPKLTSQLQKETECREIKTTREIGTQTDDDYFLNDSHNILMNMQYKVLCDRIKTLEALKNSCACKAKGLDTTDNPSSSTENGDAHAYDDDDEDEDPDYDAVSWKLL